MTDRVMNDPPFPIHAASTKMEIVGGLQHQLLAFQLLLEGMETLPEWIRSNTVPNEKDVSGSMVGLMLRMIESLERSTQQNDNRMRELAAQYHTLDGHMRVLNSNLERYSKIPERLEKVERVVWVIGLVAAFMGAIGGGIAQRYLADKFAPAVPMKQETPTHAEELPHVHRGP